MNPQENSSLQRLEEKLDNHMLRHDEDYKRLLWWIIGTLISLIIGGVSILITYGQTVEKVNRLESEQSNKVDRQELQASVLLIDEKFKNVSDKLDDIKAGLNIK